MAIQYIPEEISSRLISHELAVEATTAAYLAAAGPASAIFPVVLCHAADAANRFSIKAASAEQLVGAKIGSYWSSNVRIGQPRHSSCIILLDQTTGRISTVVEASIANGYRTAAGNALAVQQLARKDAEHLVIFGAGHQARFECEAVMRVRAIRKISIVNRDRDKGQRLATALGSHVQTSVSDAEEACKTADIIITATAARAPLFDSSWIRPGTHISCMGADAVGKQELPADLLLKAALYCDFAPQSTVIGEFQHIGDSGERGLEKPINIGDVLSGCLAGRRNAEVVTIFDSSGLALQDLCLAQCLLREAGKRQMISILQ